MRWEVEKEMAREVTDQKGRRKWVRGNNISGQGVLVRDE